jgi:carboxymethylenebutenolidase
MGDMIELGGDARGYLAVPDTGAGPGVLVLQEWWGLNPQMKGTADHLADNGFVALAPDLYRGELAGHDEMDKAGQLMTTLPSDRAAADMSVAVDHLLDLDAAAGSSIGALGFCMGGLMTLLIAALRPEVGAAVPFYGFPTGDEPDWTTMQAVVRGHFCENDDFFPSSAARDLERRLQTMGKDVQITFHDEGHAFMNETDPFGIYNAELAAELWPQVFAFLHEQLS